MSKQFCRLLQLPQYVEITIKPTDPGLYVNTHTRVTPVHTPHRIYLKRLDQIYLGSFHSPNLNAFVCFPFFNPRYFAACDVLKDSVVIGYKKGKQNRTRGSQRNGAEGINCQGECEANWSQFHTAVSCCRAARRRNWGGVAVGMGREGGV